MYWSLPESMDHLSETLTTSAQLLIIMMIMVCAGKINQAQIIVTGEPYPEPLNYTCPPLMV